MWLWLAEQTLRDLSVSLKKSNESQFFGNQDQVFLVLESLQQLKLSSTSVRWLMVQKQKKYIFPYNYRNVTMKDMNVSITAVKTYEAILYCLLFCDPEKKEEAYR